VDLGEQLWLTSRRRSDPPANQPIPVILPPLNIGADRAYEEFKLLLDPQKITVIKAGEMFKQSLCDDAGRRGVLPKIPSWGHTPLQSPNRDFASSSRP
jgi:hypothetical protein